MATAEALNRHYRHACFFAKELAIPDAELVENEIRFHEAAILPKEGAPNTTRIQPQRGPNLMQLPQWKEPIEARKWKLEMKLNEHLIPLVFASCREICSLVSAMLPRELRDEVYGHLIWPNPFTRCSEVIVVEKSSSGCYPSHFRPSRCVNKGWPNPPHFWQPDCVGEEFVHELAEVWYKSVTFNFQCDSHLIQPFLKNKTWKGLDPAELVRQVKLTIQVDLCEENSDLRYNEGLDAATLLANLQKFALLRAGTHLDIDISMIRNFEVPWGLGVDADYERFENVLKDLWPVFCEFVSSGKVLQIVLDAENIITQTNTEFSIVAWVQRLREYDTTKRKKDAEYRRRKRCSGRRLRQTLEDAHAARLLQESGMNSGFQAPGSSSNNFTAANTDSTSR